MVQRSGVLIETYSIPLPAAAEFSTMYTYETKVLIETYWNVKMKSKGKDREIFRKVLIETYWNVKYDMKKISGSEFLY